MPSHYVHKFKDHRWKTFHIDTTARINFGYCTAIKALQSLCTLQNRLDELKKEGRNSNIAKSTGKQQQQKQANKDAKKRTSGGFPMKTLIFSTFIVLGGVIFSDVQSSGTWKDSKTAFLLKKYHVCEYSHKVLNKTQEGIRWVNSEIDKQFPGYEKKLHETLEPYSVMLSELGVVTYNAAGNAKDAVVAGYLIVVDKIQEQAPGLLEKTGDSIRYVVSTTATYTKKGVTYLREEVFVGSLSPENMGKVIANAAKATQQKVNEFYVWAYEKIRTVVT